jgi:chemotaxis protein MotB
MKLSKRSWQRVIASSALAVSLTACVTTQKYNSMLQQQKALEASLQSEMNADQVKIEQLEDGIRVRMSGELLYRSGSVNLSPSGEKTLSKVAPQLATMAAQNNEIDVVGNTDNVPIGPELAARYPTNWELAGARAAVVVRYLQENGVDPSKLRAISAGQYHPIDPNNSASGQEQNRRTDLLLRPQANSAPGPQ